MKSILDYSHNLLAEIVQEGDQVIDGTVGNGHDTCFLAQLVGSEGHVYGYDIQKIAINRTQEKLTANGLSEQVTLFHLGHEKIAETLPEKENIAGAIFNLGYLPQSDKSIITLSETTLPALESALLRIKKGGRLVVVVYYGHPGGEEEKDAVLKFASKLNQKSFDVLRYQFINQVHQPPFIIAIEKK